MSGLDDRKDAFENKFAHEQEMAFKIEARGCKLFGLWAAEKLDFKGDDAESYAKEVVAANIDEPGFHDIKRKVMRDFSENGIDVSEHMIDRQIEIFMDMASKQIMSEPGKV